MKNLVVLLEERSAMQLLLGVLPRVLPPGTQVQYLVFQGKQDLEKNITRKLRAWQDPNAAFLVVRDQDRAACSTVKAGLAARCADSGKAHWKVRVACREVESWLLGDLAAVEKGLDCAGLADQQEKRKYRNPDGVQLPSEELRRLTNGIYQKVAGCRAIGPHLSLEGNRSRSFMHLVGAARALVDE